MLDYFEGDNESEYDSENDSETESNMDKIYEEDFEHAEKEKDNFKYYIGITKLIKPYSYYLLLNSISSNMFFRYPYKSILNYLSEYSIIENYKPKIDILKLIIIDNVYTVIKKTYWIRIIQRHWKKALKERHIMTLKRGSIVSQRNFEITGKYPIGLRILPGIYGLLSNYK